MTTVSEIIRRGYREGNFIAIGATPSTQEQDEGLLLLQAIVDTVFPITVGTAPAPWFIPLPQRNADVAANYPALPGEIQPPTIHDITLPPPNVRLLMKNTSDTTVYFQYQPQDGALMEYVDVNHSATVTLDANGALFGATGVDTQVVIQAMPEGRNATRKWVYRGDLGAWVEIPTLTLTTDLPFPSEFDDYFVTELALRLNPSAGNEPRQITVMRNREMKTHIRQLYVQMAEAWFADPGLRAEQTYRTPEGLNNFNTGR